MTLLSPTVPTRKRRHAPRKRRGHLIPVTLCCSLAIAAAALIAYLLWPTWQSRASNNPDRIPVSVGGTLFNVPAHAFRRKVQKQPGPQERVDLNYNYPSLDPPDAPRHVSVETFDENVQPIDRMFVSISAHHDALSPEVRLRTVYPRHLTPAAAPAQDGLVVRTFREGSAYGNEDLFLGAQPALVARCTRDGATPGMCLSERRIGGADLTFRFPLAWLTQWRDVANAMEQLTAQLSHPRG